MNPQVENFLKGLLFVVAFAVLTFLANATNLTGIIGPQWTVLVTGFATALLGLLGGHVEAKTGKALFGAAKR